MLVFWPAQARHQPPVFVGIATHGCLPPEGLEQTLQHGPKAQGARAGHGVDQQRLGGIKIPVGPVARGQKRQNPAAFKIQFGQQVAGGAEIVAGGQTEQIGDGLIAWQGAIAQVNKKIGITLGRLVVERNIWEMPQITVWLGTGCPVCQIMGPGGVAEQDKDTVRAELF